MSNQLYAFLILLWMTHGPIYTSCSLAVSNPQCLLPPQERSILLSLSVSTTIGRIDSGISGCRPSCPATAETVRELREVSVRRAPVRVACNFRVIMMQLMMTRTETAVTPRMASRIVPAGGFSKGDEPEGCGDDCARV